MTNVNAIVVAAMKDEMKPMLSQLEDLTVTSVSAPHGKAQLARKGRSRILLLTTGVGMVAASSLLSWALAQYSTRIVISIGSAGGLDSALKVGDLVVGTRYINCGADATAFGYDVGQVPGQPMYFDIHESLAEPLAQLRDQSDQTVHVGTVLSSDSFVTEDIAQRLITQFPGALSADMESQALAQVAQGFDVPFVSLRSISDVAGGQTASDQAETFKTTVSDVANLAAKTAIDVLWRTGALDVERSAHGPAQHFSTTSLRAAMYLMLARAHNLEPATDVPVDDMEDITSHLADLPEDVRDHTLGLVVAGYELAKTDTNATLTAKKYDEHRAQFVENYSEEDRKGFLWPPTSQTVIKRFNGYWNDALASIGLTPRRGRSRGGLKFTTDDYLFAIRSYIVDSQREHRQPSFNNYSTWLTDSGNYGKLPSGAAIRQRFGSWREALTAAQTRS
ncbi:5'-methylthioadenosine/S-adenosylhomocysteine nucleosidase [Trueperella bialowiezensis]|uniref:adenosylhomocysteine nucleosidase n=1 Tax=Trueperella bialowiezensis TaxID=312285 RepID=A0A3S4V6X9_9ACTO|nr:5'-methylthioadenosine/S-adenosylhomocysteine nucleosidase [Trueperella bialowiezensis]VEI13373.1 5'-methylthioadenosine/S-adenosylhomocysteine nucleosidase [Trueperella bialowiezensis]